MEAPYKGPGDWICGSPHKAGIQPSVTLQFPDDVFSALRRSPEEFGRELRVAAAIHWYERGELSQEKATHVAGLTRVQFLAELARTKSDAFVVDFEDLKRELSLG
jgi:predicted HTH domain antitoxin